MKTDKTQYQNMVKLASPPSTHLKNWALSFLIGGAVCAFGEGLSLFFKHLRMSEEQARAMVPVTLIVLTAVFTAFGLYDRLAKHAGAGLGVPITGFANSIVSPAMEFQSEGRILGVGMNLFRLAGPVLVYGSAVCTLYGVIYYFFIR
ncbi:MAG: SpoVA/SpoVAEb family sporulation membrane protein [Oscillospiraceae bacterium]|nr:SpoVA/SpoVAEb family sporulation membrane protein [Oscillospiraceae bacterium]